MDHIEYYVVQFYVVLRVGPQCKQTICVIHLCFYLFFDNLKMINIYKIKHTFINITNSHSDFPSSTDISTPNSLHWKVIFIKEIVI